MLCFSRDFGMWGGVGMWIFYEKFCGIWGFLSGIRDYVEKWGGYGYILVMEFWRDGMRESGKYADLLGDLEGRDWIVKNLSMFEMDWNNIVK